MAAWHWAGLAISAEVLQLKVGANQEKSYMRNATLGTSERDGQGSASQ
ncbi:hypothetical protein AZ54_08045 [Xanthomonas oryzae pv. oryzae PXO86]|nr:hypothetical protein AZ54_08045 [Xanthomonas oryzae pv. oryzae PXO86]